MEEKVFKAGEIAPKTGLYAVRHQQHRVEHQAMVLQGEHFPACTQCACEVQFRLVHAAVAIEQDADFKPRKARAHTRSHA